MGGICPGVNDVLRSLVHKVGSPPCPRRHLASREAAPAAGACQQAHGQHAQAPPPRLYALPGLPALQAVDYGVPENNILGIRYGFRGFYDREHKPVALTRRWATQGRGPRAPCMPRGRAPALTGTPLAAALPAALGLRGACCLGHLGLHPSLLR